MTREEIELMGRLSKLLVEEKDPDQFTNLVRQLEDLLDKIATSKMGKLTPGSTLQSSESFSVGSRRV